jgi:hypothetical protein
LLKLRRVSSGLPASRRAPDLPRPTCVRVPLVEHAGHGGEGLSARRRDAASPLLARQGHADEVENRSAGVPIRGRGVSPLVQRPTRLPTLISASRTANPSERGHREARAGGVVFRA